MHAARQLGSFDYVCPVFIYQAERVLMRVTFPLLSIRPGWPTPATVTNFVRGLTLCEERDSRECTSKACTDGCCSVCLKEREVPLADAGGPA